MTAAKHKRRRGNPAKPSGPRYRPAIWHRNHQFALFGIVGATALTLLVGFLGPSAVTLTLGPRHSYLPPWYLPAGVIKPNEWFVSILIWAAIILGALGLWVGLRAMADGWKPRYKKLFGLGTVLSLLTICVPPMTSADVLMYAAYGRLQAIGRDPYEITPAEVFRGQFDPVLSWTERPWQDTPSVYGPITSWTQLARQQARWRQHARHRVLAAGVLGRALHLGLRRRLDAGAWRSAPAGPSGVVDDRESAADLGCGCRRSQRGAGGDVRGSRPVVHAQEPFRCRSRHWACRVREGEHRALGARHAVGVPARTEEGAAALPRHVRSRWAWRTCSGSPRRFFSHCATVGTSRSARGPIRFIASLTSL